MNSIETRLSLSGKCTKVSVFYTESSIWNLVTKAVPAWLIESAIKKRITSRTESILCVKHKKFPLRYDSAVALAKWFGKMVVLLFKIAALGRWEIGSYTLTITNTVFYCTMQLCAFVRLMLQCEFKTSRIGKSSWVDFFFSFIQNNCKSIKANEKIERSELFESAGK